MSNPFLATLPWAGVTGITGASGATYATGANAWSGQLMNVQPAANFFTPSGPIAAENLNYMFNERDNALIYINNLLPVQNNIISIQQVNASSFGSWTSDSISCTAANGDLFLVLIQVVGLSGSGVSVVASGVTLNPSATICSLTTSGAGMGFGNTSGAGTITFSGSGGGGTSLTYIQMVVIQFRP